MKEIDALPVLRQRLDAAQMFNGYELVTGGYAVSLGPISDRVDLIHVESCEIANLLVAALRAANGQPPVLCPLEEYDAEEDAA